MSHRPPIPGQMDVYECIREVQRAKANHHQEDSMNKPVKAADVTPEVRPGSALKKAQREVSERVKARKAREAAMRAQGDQELQEIRGQQAQLKRDFLERQARRDAR